MHLSRSLAGALAIALACCAAAAHATPSQLVPVRDPIVSELRVLDLYEGGTQAAGLRLPHMGAGPWQVCELPDSGSATRSWSGARALAARRIWREIARDVGRDGSTRRLVQREWPGNERMEISAGLEGAREFSDVPGNDRAQWANGSGLHTRAALQINRWLLYSHVFFGELRGVRAFSDELFANTDIATSTEDSYLAYSAGTRGNAMIGRSRWHWGPSEEASLLISRSSVPLNGMLLHLRVEGLRADLLMLNATVEPGLGEQLAAHRLEWQPRDGVRVGLSEAARYHAGGWQGVYLSGVIPYSFAQRLLDQDHGGATEALRNNVLVATDASVRVADGSRLYAELLLDDLHLRSGDFPNKYGWQLGWDGAGMLQGVRATWNAEYTMLSRYVYTSSYGRTFTAQDEPLGFPAGPDSRRLRARFTLDPRPDWQCTLLAVRTERGESGLDAPFVPGSPVPDVGAMLGVIERTRTVDATLRWWPASGLDLSARVGREWREGVAHVAGATAEGWRGGLAVRAGW